MLQRRWKVGLLGAGYICDSHAKALKVLPGVEVVAICDRVQERAESAAGKHGIRGVFNSLDDMLGADLDVVHVLLPPDLHIDATRRILESGRHAFLEKPMGPTSMECQDLVDLANSRRLQLGVDHNFLFLPSAETLRRHARDGTLGALDHITVNWLYPLGLIQAGPFSNWMLRAPQNLLLELGPHLLAFVLDLVGPLSDIRASVSCPIDLPGGARVYRHWHVHGQSGRTAVDLNLSVLPGPSDRSIVVRGHGALAKCYFDRDLYYVEEPNGDGLFDNVLTAAGVGWQLGANAGRNLFKSLAGTLRKAPEASPFSESVARSIARFYATIDGALDSRLDGQFGANVIAECERIAGAVSFDAPVSERRVWAVTPPARPPTVLVLGGTGFIGRYLVRALVSRGVSVRVATRGMSSAQLALAGLPVDLVQGELSDPAFVDAALAGIEVVYDLAKAVGSKWEDYYRQDVMVTKNIAERALANGVKRFIFTGTIASYYSANASHVIASDTALDPGIHRRNHYARSKAACEALLMEMHRKRGLPVIIFRPGIVIGKGCSPAHGGVGIFSSETRVKFCGDGENPLPFVLVEDVADALVLALDKPGIEGQTYLLTDEPLLSAREYVDAVSDACGTRIRATPTAIWKFYAGDLLKETVKHLIRHPNRRTPSFRDWDSKSQRARYDSSKTRQALGWAPAGTREALIERGVVEAVRDSTR